MPKCCQFKEGEFEDLSIDLGTATSLPTASCLDCVHDQILEEPTDWLATRTPVVVGPKHFELISLNKVLAAEQDCGDLLLLYQTTQALGVDAEHASGLDKV